MARLQSVSELAPAMKRFLLILLLTALQLPAQTLWQQASAGMSKADVAKLYPEAKCIQHIVDRDFKVSFKFTSDKLSNVSLEYKGKSAIDGSQA